MFCSREKLIGLINTNAVERSMDTPECMMADESRHVTKEDGHMGALSTYMRHGWPSNRAEVLKGVQPYWFFRDEVVVIDRIEIKGRRIIGSASLQKKHLISFMSTTWV